MSAISRPNGDVDALRRHRGAEWLEADAAGIDAVVNAEVAAGIAICFDEADFELNLLAGAYGHRVGDAVAGKVLGNLHGAGNRGCAAHFTLQQTAGH
jgi:fructose-1,6-bisphosphatase/sedoheptulose 1,7-bisphosphatase-like protein